MDQVVVVGGGLAGVAAAVTLGRAGFRVLLAEERGCLGWEVNRAGRLFADLSQGQVAGTLKSLVTSRQGFSSGVLNPAVVEMALDRMVEEAGVELLFHARPHRLRRDKEQFSGIVLAIRNGPFPVSADLVIDATHTGRLVREYPRQFRTKKDPPTVVFGLLLSGTEIDCPLTITEGLPKEVSAARLTPLNPERCLLDVHLSLKEGVDTFDPSCQAELTLARVITPVLETIRGTVNGAERATVLLTAAEAWYLPFQSVQLTGYTACKGLIAAGAYLEDVRSRLSVPGEEIDCLLDLGESVAKSILSS
ncbi:MAG: FAD-dependent oxidoreductase [Firmicutes bacterium]|jgi:hypothetical protein|nr:FAD-dependent oxidoreductase [Bacillota bacterium]